MQPEIIPGHISPAIETVTAHGALRPLVGAACSAFQETASGEWAPCDVLLPNWREFDGGDVDVLANLSCMSAVLEDLGLRLGAKVVCEGEAPTVTFFDFVEFPFRDADGTQLTLTISEAADRSSAMVEFVHPVFLSKYQTFSSLSLAFAAAYQAAKSGDWKAFGDEETRRTLLHKGQFYWEAPQGLIPVDNFVYAEQGAPGLVIAGHGTWCSVVRHDAGAAKGTGTVLQYSNYAEALTRIASIGCEGAKELMAGRTPTVPAPRGEVAAGVLVTSIYSRGDQHAVETLLFRTGEGDEVRLRTAAGPGWRVALRRAGTAEIATEELPPREALALLATVLKDGVFPEA